VTYEELVAQYSLRVCTGCGRGDHEAGFVEVGRFHWRLPRRLTRPGLRRFLRLVAQSQLGIRNDDPEPAKTYWISVMTDALAAGLHVRFPRKYSELDRAFVRAQLADHRPKGLDEDTRMRLYRWAMRQ
jgi:hypothetical protein